ncbi:class I SAM-dependent methyltransferase [bacterium]|nr:class I SAM-dependent methyltransferase [bacterium]
MQRIPEPELMDTAEQARAYAAADFADVNQKFVERFRRTFPDFQEGVIVDLGCGPADICVRIARALPKVRLVAVDGAEAMLAPGRVAVTEAGLDDRVTLVHSLLPTGMLAGPFHAVISNSLLHHLPDPMTLWNEVKHLGRPGAPVLIVDLFRPGSEKAARAIVEEADVSDDPILLEDFYNSLLAAYTLAEVRDQLARAGLSSLHSDIVSERHLAVWGRLP